ncbi:MAG: hypothetical protein NTZ60_08070 [Campylobacterales bacterium]|nr:hypothetical protein [Campylobacterales bacterium]
MISLDNKAFFWKEFDEDNNPIKPKECQITFTPNNGGKLIFLDDLKSEFNYDEKKSEVISKIYGQAVSGKQFTLINTKFNQAEIHMELNFEMTYLEYAIEFIFYGGWYEIEKPINIFYVRYSYLELFFNQLEIKPSRNDNDKTMAGIMIHKKALQCSTADHNILFDIKNKFNQSSFNNKSVTYEATNSLAVAKKDKFELTEAIELSNVIISFFEILTFYSKNKIFIEEFYIMEEQLLKDGINKVPIHIDILFQQVDYEEEKKMSHLDFLLTYQDIKENFVQILNNWIKNHDKNQNEYMAFCNVIADKKTKFNIYSHYFQLVSALEGYHRRNNNKDLEFRQKINQLINQSEIKTLLPLNNKIHTSISNCIYNMRNNIAHSNKSIEINDRVKSSYEYLKLIVLMIMLKDISLNQAHISRNILDIDLKYIENKLIEAFSKSPVITK